MMRGYFPSLRIGLARRIVLGALTVFLTAPFCMRAAQQAALDVPSGATPQIQQINPGQATPGAHITVTIQGNNFSAGAVVSSASTVIHVDSSKRISATQMEVQLTVSDSAQPGTASLLVSNPASSAAESAFSIVAAQAAPAPAAPPQSTEPPKSAAPPEPATPQTPAAPPSAPPTPDVNPAAPATPQAPAAPPTTPPATGANPAPAVTPTAPVAPPAPTAPEASPGPEVTTISPPRVAQGFDIDLRVNGKNFVQGTKVSFANEGIRVLGISSYSSTQITVHIKVAGDASTGKSSLFVINPDDNEVEVPLEVAVKGSITPPTSAPPAPGTTPTADPSFTQRFDAFHLGNPTEIFHVHGKVKGSLVISSDTVKYEEDKQTLINISLSEIKEVKTAGIGGFNIKLNSGKTHHFAAASLKGSDARTIVEAIQKAMPTTPSAN
jgi:hypothetical protein